MVFTTISLRPDTKRLLDEAKPTGAGYDWFLRRVLARLHPAELAEWFAEQDGRDRAVATASRMRRQGAPSMRRDPAEQVALAEAAADRFRMWVRTGRVTPLGPRRFRYAVWTGGAARGLARRAR